MTKPVQAEELRARVQLGCRIIELRSALKIEVGALAVALAREKLLLGRLALDSRRDAKARCETSDSLDGLRVRLCATPKPSAGKTLSVSQ